MTQGICILGDSIAKGVIFDAQRSRYAIAKENLGKQIARVLECSVTNLSKFGSTVADGLARFEKQKESLPECEAVLMNFGGNDSDFLWQEVSAAPDELHKPKTPIDVFEQTYLKLIERVKESGKTPILLNLPPVDHARYFSWISRELNADNILKWLGGTSEFIYRWHEQYSIAVQKIAQSASVKLIDIRSEFIYRWHEQYSIAVQKIAQSASVKLIDIRSAFLERRDYCDFLSADGIHPNEQGHSMISQIILQKI